MSRASYRTPLSDRLFDVVNYSFLTACLIVVLYPLLYVVSASFSSPTALLGGRVFLWPVDVGLDGYRAVFRGTQVWTGYRNTVIYTSMGTIINVTLTIALAYPLSRRDFIGRNAIMFFITFTLIFSGGIIPTFLLVRSLGLYNTVWAMVIPNAIHAWNVIIARTYLRTTIPGELLEAAQLDGCSNTRFLYAIVVPLSGPVIAAIGLFYAVDHWNSFFAGLIYLQDRKLYPLQIVLREILLQNQVDTAMITDIQELIRRQHLSELLKYSLIVVASVPILAIYPFVQRYFVKGVMIGAIKG